VDIPIRFGGEEFVVFMPAGSDAVFAFAESVRQQVEAMSFDLGVTSIKVTISGGVTAHRSDEALEEFMNRADKLLYVAKNQGRNQNVLN